VINFSRPAWRAVSIALSSIAMLAACARVRQGASTKDHSGADVIRELHLRYTGKRFTHVTFVQTTEPSDGATETWYEALAPLGRVRVDIAPLSARNAFFYRNDSNYVLRNGSIVVAQGNQRWLSMLMLLDIYALPLEAVLRRLAELGLDVADHHDTQWRGRPVHVVGALAGDTISPQVWLDEEHLYAVRLVQRAADTGVTYVWHISEHRFLEGGWIEGEIRIFSAGRLLVRERYAEITPRPGLPDSLFQPTPYREPGWLTDRASRR
jgi:hypothetical protein